jgi:hypothetical protein
VRLTLLDLSRNDAGVTRRISHVAARQVGELIAAALRLSETKAD